MRRRKIVCLFRRSTATGGKSQAILTSENSTAMSKSRQHSACGRRSMGLGNSGDVSAKLTSVGIHGSFSVGKERKSPIPTGLPKVLSWSLTLISVRRPAVCRAHTRHALLTNTS